MIKINTITINQTVITHSGGRTLFSYDTPIVTVTPSNNVIAHPAWAYSRTTSKYRAQFLNETTAETRAKLVNGTYIMQDFK